MSERETPPLPTPDPKDSDRKTTTTTTTTNNNNSSRNKNGQDWWMPSFPRWPYRSWTELFFPRNDLIGILAGRVVVAMDKHLDPDGPTIGKLLDERLPADGDSVRDKLPFYESTVDALRYQRDRYLLGDAYAGEKQAHRDRVRRSLPSSSSRGVGVIGGVGDALGSPAMPLDATVAQGYFQTVALGSRFVPSETIRGALLPIVVSLPSGALKETVTTTVSNAIPLAQPPLDAAMKTAVMGVMRDPQIRQMIKNRTQKILRIEDEDGKDDDNDDRNRNGADHPKTRQTR